MARINLHRNSARIGTFLTDAGHSRLVRWQRNRRGGLGRNEDLSVLVNGASLLQPLDRRIDGVVLDPEGTEVPEQGGAAVGRRTDERVKDAAGNRRSHRRRRGGRLASQRRMLLHGGDGRSQTVVLAHDVGALALELLAAARHDREPILD